MKRKAGYARRKRVRNVVVNCVIVVGVLSLLAVLFVRNGSLENIINKEKISFQSNKNVVLETDENAYVQDEQENNNLTIMKGEK